MRMPVAFGPGVIVTTSLCQSFDRSKVTMTGHTSFGIQYAFADRDRRISVVYLTNTIYPYHTKDLRFKKLVQAFYDSPEMAK